MNLRTVQSKKRTIDPKRLFLSSINMICIPQPFTMGLYYYVEGKQKKKGGGGASLFILILNYVYTKSGEFQ